jgi:hypothetical protein
MKVGRKSSVISVCDTWELIPEEWRSDMIEARLNSMTTRGLEALDQQTTYWEPLRPLTLDQRAFRHLEEVSFRLLRLAVEACRRRASTVGELHRALRFPHKLPLIDPDRPLGAVELTRYARPDLLIERGRLFLLEFNNCPRLGGVNITSRLADTFARLCPWAGLSPPISAVAARSAALVRTMGGHVGPSNPRTLLIPTYWTVDDDGIAHHHAKVKRSIVNDARRVGFDVIQKDLNQLHIDCTGRLRAEDAIIDIVLINWGSDARMINDGGGLAALRRADLLGTVELFPRSESDLISSKAVLAWLHDDCDAELLTPADRDLVRSHVPYTRCLGMDDGNRLHPHSQHGVDLERDRLIAKPAAGKSGIGVMFGSRADSGRWRRATVEAAKDQPIVLQNRIVPDRIRMPFVDRGSGRRTTVRVPAVISPFLIDNAAASVAVRHATPDTSENDVVISASLGACPNTTLLTSFDS